MSHLREPLCQEAIDIWQAGVDSVRGDQLVNQRVQLDGSRLTIVGMNREPVTVNLNDFQRVCVVGAGKAAAALAVALEQKLLSYLTADRLCGWVNVPDEAVLAARQLTVHPCRPPGVNEPTARAVAGTEAILRLVTSLTQQDLCLVVLTGGGSALLPAPVTGISWQDKSAVARWLSAAGADIRELNTIRKRLSRIKGGGLARACPARLISLIISDVLGDPLDVIASGPTVPDTASRADALAVMHKYDPARKLAAAAVWTAIEHSTTDPAAPLTQAINIILANNQTAVQRAAAAAVPRGYEVEVLPTDINEPTAEAVGRQLASRARQLSSQLRPHALVSGGEPVVELAPPELRGHGGRNQQLVLAALDELQQTHSPFSNTTLLSGGTDGEDGPTDAAGAVIGAAQMARVETGTLDISGHLQRNDAYPLLDELRALFKTGPTQTNVCDLRVVLHKPPP